MNVTPPLACLSEETTAEPVDKFSVPSALSSLMPIILLPYIVFCSCTRKTSSGELAGFEGSIRVCHFCYSILQNPNLAADINKIIDTASTAAEATRTGDLVDDSDDETDAVEEKLLSNTYERVAFAPRTIHA